MGGGTTLFALQIFRVGMADVRREYRGETRVMILGQPHWEDVELVISGEHRVEGRQVPKCLLHHLSARIDEDAVHGGRNPTKLVRAACGK